MSRKQYQTVAKSVCTGFMHQEKYLKIDKNGHPNLHFEEYTNST